MNKIIFGKDTTERIVNISYKDDYIYYFQETENGKVIQTRKPFKPWALSPKAYRGTKPLLGNQYYKYIYEFDSYREFHEKKHRVYELDLYTVFNMPEAFMMKEGFTYFKNMKTQDVSLLSFDIETSGLNWQNDDAEVFLITNVFRKQGKLLKKTFCIEEYETQYDMIRDWCIWVMDNNPSLIIGHNIVMFDLPYLMGVMSKIGEKLILGRDESPANFEDRKKPRELRKDGSQTYSYNRIEIFGRDIVDTFFLAIKADIAKKYESYRLKSIIAQEGLEKEGRQHYPANLIKVNWGNPEERKKIIQYGEDDAEDPIKVYDLMIAPFFYLTPYIPKPFQIMIESASGSQLNSLMVRSYLQDGYSVAKANESTKFEGAVSFGNPGIYSNVFKVDVASLYPSIMREFKIFPKGKDYNNNFLTMLEYFTLERLSNKKKAKDTGDRYYKDLEQAQKVVINSAYGFMGASGLNYNYPEGAAEVTRYGREIIIKSHEWATGRTLKHALKSGKADEYEWVPGEWVCSGKGYTISNCDTDSISFTTGKDLSLEDRKQILNELNSLYPKMIKFEDDGYFKKVIIMKAKNYVLYDGEKIKLKGSSLKDQKKEPILKQLLSDIIKAIIEDRTNDLNLIYETYIKMCYKVEDIKMWSQKKTITKAVLKCKTDKNVRLNEMKIYDAINGRHVQEGDKIYVYPAIVGYNTEIKTYKNGTQKEKKMPIEKLKMIEDWNNDHDSEKFVNRVYKTLEILDSVVDMNQFVDYTIIKNKPLLEKLVNG